MAKTKKEELSVKIPKKQEFEWKMAKKLLVKIPKGQEFV